MKKKQREGILISILIPLAVGFLSSWLTGGAMEAFSALKKPPLSPPGYLFPILWTILYVLMGVASYLIYSKNGAGIEAEKGLALYGLQLVVNFFWSIFFFRFEWYLFSFFWLVLLWILIWQTIRMFAEVNKTAAKLMVPYLLWVTFAGYLNFCIFLLNRH